jgi:2-keto-4-pentenoate hydratase/2-oxohepta-3-ene-1,7-dioic acid hydratase in catechol pathway
MTGRFARVLFEGRERWIRLTDEREVVLIGGPLSDAREGQERSLSREEVQGLVYLAPYFGEKVVGLAYNYRSLVGEKNDYEEPLFFLKSPTSPCGCNAVIKYPPFAEAVWVEAELTIIMGKECRDVSPADAGDYVLGYTVGSDVTARNVHGRDHHLARSKALDSFAPMGPYLVSGIDTSDLEMTTLINGETYQSGTTSEMILDSTECVSLVSKYITLRPGDAILTGTPAGAMQSLVKPGDHVRHEIEGVGVLEFSFAEQGRGLTW